MFNQNISAFAASSSINAKVNECEANAQNIQNNLIEEADELNDLFGLADCARDNANLIQEGTIIDASIFGEESPKYYKYIGQNKEGNPIFEETGMIIVNDRYKDRHAERFTDYQIEVDLTPENGDVALTRTALHTGKEEFWAYDNAGNCIEHYSENSNGNNRTLYTYDKKGQITGITADWNDDGKIDTQYEYGYKNGVLTTVKNGNSEDTYGKNGKIEKSEDDFKTITFKYNKDGQMTKAIENNGILGGGKNKYTFKYYDSGRLKSTYMNAPGKENDTNVTHEFRKEEYLDSYNISFGFSYPNLQ